MSLRPAAAAARTDAARAVAPPSSRIDTVLRIGELHLKASTSANAKKRIQPRINLEKWIKEASEMNFVDDFDQWKRDPGSPRNRTHRFQWADAYDDNSLNDAKKMDAEKNKFVQLLRSMPDDKEEAKGAFQTLVNLHNDIRDVMYFPGGDGYSALWSLMRDAMTHIIRHFDLKWEWEAMEGHTDQHGFFKPKPPAKRKKPKR